MGTIKNYGLYQTLVASTIPTTDLKATQETFLFEKLSQLDVSQTTVVFMLICEHARIEGDMTYDPLNLILPYTMKQDSRDVKVDLKKLPIFLKWILLRFVKVITEKN